MSISCEEARYKAIHGEENNHDYDHDQLKRFISYAEDSVDICSKEGKFYTYSFWSESKKLNEELAQHFTSKGFKTKVKFDPFVGEYHVRIGWYESWMERYAPWFARIIRALTQDEHENDK